jgi:hypothetical protein
MTEKKSCFGRSSKRTTNHAGGEDYEVEGESGRRGRENLCSVEIWQEVKIPRCQLKKKNKTGAIRR